MDQWVDPGGEVAAPSQTGITAPGASAPDGVWSPARITARRRR
jgi:hypothetical protein